jgi:hypothetical protein
MIDTLVEVPIPLADAAKIVRSRPVSRATMYRWADAGVRGVKLEVIRVGGSLCTSREAMQRFCERTTRSQQAGYSGRKRTAKQRKAADQAAERRLVNRGA